MLAKATGKYFININILKKFLGLQSQEKAKLRLVIPARIIKCLNVSERSHIMPVSFGHSLFEENYYG